MQTALYGRAVIRYALTVSHDTNLAPAIAWLPDALERGRRLLGARPLGYNPDDVWLLDLGGRPVVLKRDRLRPGGGERDVVWEHAFLDRLIAAGFPAQRPFPLFAGGKAWHPAGGRVWHALEYLPGRSLMWEPHPDMADAGAFLAAYHHVARAIAVETERPTATPLHRLAALLPWDSLPAAAGSAAEARRVAGLLGEMDTRLRTAGYDELERFVIHGDFTTDNVVIDGSPPRVTGVIDFGSAYHEGWPADISFGLWRSGRTHWQAVALDLDRVRRFVRGYYDQAAISPQVARLLPVLLWARGLQLLVRAMLRTPAQDQPVLVPVTVRTLARIDWIRAHEPELAAAIATACDA